MLNGAGELDFDSDDESNNGGKMPQAKPMGQMQPGASLLRRSTRISQKLKSKKDAQQPKVHPNPFMRNFDYNEDRLGVD